MISAANAISSTTNEHVTRETRGSDDRANDFAAMLAGAAHSTESKPEPKKTKEEEGTSELDKPEEKHEETEKTEGKKKVKRSRPTPTAGTNEVVQATTALDPELQSKLARVITRMEQETGHDVTVAETYRSQERQNTLYAQGREATGPVVTWTRNSKHTQGRAVDLVLDGGDAGLDAYTTLQRIANEEGLRTLGARDPGHIELPGSGQPLNANVIAKEIAKGQPLNASVIAKEIANTPVAPADASSPGQVNISRLAQVAQVAEVVVARPAEVARVATVARPGTSGIASVAPASETSQNVVAVADIKSQGGASTSGTNDKNSNSGESKGEQRGGYGALAAAVAMRNEAASQNFAVPTVGATHVNGAERAAQIIAAYQDAPARPLSQITMNVDNGNGIIDRVQVAMRGASLNAAIDAGDTRGAQAMTQRADELVRALTRDGVEVESLRVRAAAASTTVTTVAGSQQPQSGSDASAHSRFERSPWQQQQDRQRSQDERRQQQRQQRGGQSQ